MKEKEQLQAGFTSLKFARLYCRMHPEATHIEKREADIRGAGMLDDLGYGGILMGYQTTKRYYTDGREIVRS
jgi:hypothetical protein